ncbi:MAG: pilus assembly protein PilM [Candidatus Omnitrophica bacterium]|nr:pilus assembly protein PilM [Candidatus Omnitrophota bacterium]MDD5310809.1 pilus assembly protein PilM [Candidatus Omnitrophota bacterium]MDD5546806.1 pilus assembly protein PilM [Candidatus Omnitrophota bacterium]
MNFKKKEIYIGIDIGSSAIKAVEIGTGPAGDIILKKAGLVPKEEGVKKAVAGMNVKSARVTCVADCPEGCLRYFTIPKMSDREIPEAVRWQVKEKVSLPLDELFMDYKLQETAEGGISKYKVKLAVMPAKAVDSIVGALAGAAISPAALFPPPLAIEKLSNRMGLQGGEAAAVVDIGHNYTGINITKDGYLAFTRNVNSGAAAITKDLNRPAAERLAQEIDRSLHYYGDESSGDKVRSVVLTGGGASIKGLAEFLQENLGVPVSQGDPFKGISLEKGALADPAPASGIFAGAVGAALSEGRGINLLPPELKQKTIRTFEKAAVESVVAAVAVSLVLSFIGMRVQLANYDKKISYGIKEMEVIKPQLEITSHYERLAAELSERKAFIDSVLSGIPPWKETLKELSNRLPKYAVLSSLKADASGLEISGQITGDVKDREKALSGIISSLEGGMFKSVTLLNAKMGEGTNSNTEFDIKCLF